MFKLVEALKNGRSLRVVLTNREGQEGHFEKEAYALTSAVIQQEFIWGGFGAVHSSSVIASVAKSTGGDADPTVPSSYYYSPQFPFVCQASWLQGRIRFYDRRAYSKLTFIAVDDSSLLATRDGDDGHADIAAIRRQVDGGATFRLVAFFKDGRSECLPVHTLEVFPSGQLLIYTDVNAWPLPLEDPGTLARLTDMIADLDWRADDPKVNGSEVLPSGFRPLYYVMGLRGEQKKWSFDQGDLVHAQDITGWKLYSIDLPKRNDPIALDVC